MSDAYVLYSHDRGIDHSSQQKEKDGKRVREEQIKIEKFQD